MVKAVERQIFGGTNFLVVLWTLISLFKGATFIHSTSFNEIIKEDMILFFVPLIFLLVLNLLMGISSFFPQKKNKMWVLSILIVTCTLIALNTFQAKMDTMKDANAYKEQIFTF